jgi:uncharacterized protein (DUF2236 family)
MPERSQPVSRRINGERVVVLGWPRAILMQFAHPLVAAGVASHSSFRRHPFAPMLRLHGTIRTMLAMTFGTDQVAHDAADRINRIHDRVNGTLGSTAGALPAGTPYSAHDPHLLAWVQMTLLDTMPRTYELLVDSLDANEKDEFCLEARSGARLLGIPDALVPAAYAEVEQTVTDRLSDGSLVITDEARGLAHQVLSPAPVLPWPLSRLHRLLTVGTLPEPLRRAYGLEWSSDDAAALESWTARMRWMSSRTPDVLRRWRAARLD